MSRRRTHAEAVRSRLVTIRITEAQHARLAKTAQENGLTVSGMAESLVTKGKVVTIVQQTTGLDLETLTELKRIGNNLNQITHAVNSSLPPEQMQVATVLRKLAYLFLENHYFAARRDDAAAREHANDSSSAQAREEFQRNAQLRSP